MLEQDYMLKQLAASLTNPDTELGKRYWGMHIWARGYFVSTAGVDRDIIRNYVKEQQEDQLREDQLRLWKDNSE